MPRATDFPPLPDDLQIPKDFDAAQALLRANTQDEVPEQFANNAKQLAPNLWLCSNARPSYHPDSRLVSDPTITLSYNGVVCVTYTPSGWVFLNSDYMICPQLTTIFTKLLEPSALRFTGNGAGTPWVIERYNIAGNGTRGTTRLSSHNFVNHMACHPALGHVNVNPYRPAAEDGN